MAMSNEYKVKPPHNNNHSNKKTYIKKSSYDTDKYEESSFSVSNVIRIVVLIVAILIFIFSGYKLYVYFKGDDKIQDELEKLQSMYEGEDSTSDIGDSPSDDLTNLAAVKEINEETIGWIKIGDTSVNYPVLQTTDNSYYLTHTFTKEVNEIGAVFVDYRCDVKNGFKNDNTIIYGHNAKQVFRPIHDYEDLDFYKDNPIITIEAADGISDWKIFAAFLTNATPSQDNGNMFSYHNYINFNDENDFNEFYANAMKRSYIIPDVDVSYGDQIVTLSTCTNVFYNSRFVVMARRVRDGEDATVNVEGAKKNNNVYLPQVWHDTYDK